MVHSVTFWLNVLLYILIWKKSIDVGISVWLWWAHTHAHKKPLPFVWAGVSDVRSEVSRGGPRHPEGHRRRLPGAREQHLLRTEAQARLQTARPAGSGQWTRGCRLFIATQCMLASVSSQPPQGSASSLSICLSGTLALPSVSLPLCHVRRAALWRSGLPEARHTLLVSVCCCSTNIEGMCVWGNITHRQTALWYKYRL